MSSLNKSFDEEYEDDEIFIGKMTLREVKKHISLHRHTTSCADNDIHENPDESLKIIKTQSEPDLIRLDDSSISDENFKSLNNTITEMATDIRCDLREDDSFLKLERLVSEMSPHDCGGYEHDNLEMADYILKHGHDEKSIDKDANKLNNNECGSLLKDRIYEQNKIPQTHLFYTPNENKKFEADFISSPDKPKINTETFKTPAKVLSYKKPAVSSVKKTPLKTSAMYQHITSPIASYINESPRAPLVKNVHPKIPLPGPSSIPKIMKSKSQCNLYNKENVTLPSIAYKCAKNTKLIDAPSTSKMPEIQCVKKILSSLPRPVVIKHDHRENKFTKKVLLSRHEDSFADLSLHQADLSVCTQKSAFIKPNTGL